MIDVAGALAVDLSCDYAPFSVSNSPIDPLPHTSNPAIISQSLGGVAHNIAKAIHLVGAPVRLHSAVGNDLSGRAALSQLQDEGMSVSGIKTLPSPARTAQYVAVNNANKDLSLAMADMSILENIPQSTIQQLASKVFSSASSQPNVLVADANWSSDALHIWLSAARETNTPTIFEPVSTAKAIRIFNSSQSYSNTVLADIITPNTYELAAMHDFASNSSRFENPEWFAIIDGLGIPSTGARVPLTVVTSKEIVDQGIPQQAIKLLPFFPTILTKLGPQGVILTKLLKTDAMELHDETERQYIISRTNHLDNAVGVGGLYVRLFPPERVLEPHEIVSVNGIGDTFCGALACGVAMRIPVQRVVGFAQKAASLSLRSKESVSQELRGLRDQLGLWCM